MYKLCVHSTPVRRLCFVWLMALDICFALWFKQPLQKLSNHQCFDPNLSVRNILCLIFMYSSVHNESVWGFGREKVQSCQWLVVKYQSFMQEAMVWFLAGSTLRAGLEIGTNTVANVTNIVALATKTSMAFTKLLLDFTQTLSPYSKCDKIVFPISSPAVSSDRMCCLCEGVASVTLLQMQLATVSIG